MHLLEVHNPVAQQRGLLNVLKTNPRPKSLNNLTIGLVWSGTHGGDLALNRAGEIIKERFTGVKTKFYTGGNYPNPPEILKKAAKEFDVVIGATDD